jgi:hypothetical protein
LCVGEVICCWVVGVGQACCHFGIPRRVYSTTVAPLEVM